MTEIAPPPIQQANKMGMAEEQAIAGVLEALEDFADTFELDPDKVKADVVAVLEPYTAEYET